MAIVALSTSSPSRCSRPTWPRKRRSDSCGVLHLSLPLYVGNSGSLIPADGALGSCIELRDVLTRLPGTSSMALALTSRGPVPQSQYR